MNAGGWKPFSREMCCDEIRILLSLDKHERLVFGIASLKNLGQLFSLLELCDLKELLNNISRGPAHHSNSHKQVILSQKLLREIF